MPNILANTRKFKSKALLLKVETTYATDPTPTGAANWIEARNLVLTPLEADKVDRNIDLPYFGNSGQVVVGKWAKVSFDFAMAPSGTAGTAPKWGPIMLASGMSETVTAATSVAYNLVSSAFSSVGAYLNVDGVMQKLLGMRGTLKAKAARKGIPMFSFEGTAVYTTPAAGAMPTVTRTGWMLEEGVNSVNTTAITINAVGLAFDSIDWDLGNQIAQIDLPGPQVEVSITGRDPSSSVTVLAPDLATFNPFTLVENGTVVPISFTHGSAAGKKVKNDLQSRIIDVDYAEIEGNLAYKLTLDPAPVAGNDETIVTCL